tara:strand:- start:1721 stop:2734 length:1014 start_codon:yes stop_codon:yes gene_type:complete
MQPFAEKVQNAVAGFNDIFDKSLFSSGFLDGVSMGDQVTIIFFDRSVTACLTQLEQGDDNNVRRLKACTSNLGGSSEIKSRNFRAALQAANNKLTNQKRLELEGRSRSSCLDPYIFIITSGGDTTGLSVSEAREINKVGAKVFTYAVGVDTMDDDDIQFLKGISSSTEGRWTRNLFVRLFLTLSECECEKNLSCNYFPFSTKTRRLNTNRERILLDDQSTYMEFTSTQIEQRSTLWLSGQLSAWYRSTFSRFGAPQNGNVFYSQPYLDEGTEVYVSTSSLPVYNDDNGQVIGVLAVDLSVEEMRKIAGKAKTSVQDITNELYRRSTCACSDCSFKIE